MGMDNQNWKREHEKANWDPRNCHCCNYWHGLILCVLIIECVEMFHLLFVWNLQEQLRPLSCDFNSVFRRVCMCSQILGTSDLTLKCVAYELWGLVCVRVFRVVAFKGWSPNSQIPPQTSWGRNSGWGQGSKFILISNPLLCPKGFQCHAHIWEPFLYRGLLTP